jgi:UDP-N-acetylglucosamine--N-acetylmuramyl-(pentapeptide) pyrophosphoryl-undecaprenol N-acetylglucosamine transferase
MSMRVLMTGGFTLGPVTPLLAVSEEIKRRDPTVEVFWVGTKRGPERKLIAEYHIPFTPIYSGKFRRYFSFRHILDNFYFLIGFFQSLCFLIKIRPDVIVSAGGFVSVPVVIAGWLLGIPSLIHQQDARPGFANRLMAPFAKTVTVSFKKSINDFKNKNPHWIGNPVREEIFHTMRKHDYEYFSLDPSRPVLLVLGGGTGAKRINEIIAGSLPKLLKVCQVIHVTGIGKGQGLKTLTGYRVFQFLTEGMPRAYNVADLVITRGGMGTLSELSALLKPIIIMPIPDSHQEKNAEMFDYAGTVQVLNQKTLTSEKFVEVVKNSLDNLQELKESARRMTEVLPPGARAKMVDLIIKTAKK